MRYSCVVAACAAALMAPCVAPLAAQQGPSLEQVLARVATYVRELQTKVSGIVTQETYLQQARDARRQSGNGLSDTSRTLKSDLLLVRPPDADRYIEFRDVFEVNGTPVRDRQERLTKLFLTPTQASVDRIRDIAAESARHNLGDVMRTVNTPMLSLHFLLSQNQQRFRFRRQNAGTPQLAAATDFPRMDPKVFAPPNGTWIVEYRETARPTFVRGTEGRDFAATGRYWIEPATGVVLVSELVLNDDSVNTIINVSYQSELLSGFRLPIEMRERYRTPEQRVEGLATYDRFRQFQVTTSEVVGKPPGLRH